MFVWGMHEAVALRSNKHTDKFAYRKYIHTQASGVIASSVAQPDAETPPKEHTDAKVPPKSAAGATPVNRNGSIAGFVVMREFVICYPVQ